MSSSERIGSDGHLRGPAGRAGISPDPAVGALDGRVVELELTGIPVSEVPGAGFTPFIRLCPEETAAQVSRAFEAMAAGDEVRCFSILNDLPADTRFGNIYNALGSVMSKLMVVMSMRDVEMHMIEMERRERAGKTGH